MWVFRRKFLRPDTIALVPHRDYTHHTQSGPCGGTPGSNKNKAHAFSMLDKGRKTVWALQGGRSAVQKYIPVLRQPLARMPYLLLQRDQWLPEKGQNSDQVQLREPLQP